MNFKWVCKDGTDNHEWAMPYDICIKCKIQRSMTIQKPEGLQSGMALLEGMNYQERQAWFNKEKANLKDTLIRDPRGGWTFKTGK